MVLTACVVFFLPSLFIEMSVRRLLYHGFFTFICPNMLRTMQVDFACVHILWKLRQQRGISLFIHVFTVLARQVLVQSSSSSRDRSKRVMKQTIFDVPDPLIARVPLFTHEFWLYMPPSFLVSSVWLSVFFIGQNTQMIPPFWFHAVGWSGQMLDCFTGFIQCCNVFFSSFQGLFVGAESLVLQQQLSHVLHVSSCTV